MNILKSIASLGCIILLSACATPTTNLSSKDSDSIRGKGLLVVIENEGDLKSNLDGASLFGALGQSVKGKSLQAELKLQSPSIAAKDELESFFKNRFNTTRGNDFNLKVHTSYWWLGKPIGGNGDIVGGVIIEIRLESSSGQLLASSTYNANTMETQFVIKSKTISNSDIEAVQKIFDHLAHNAVQKFITTVS